jgi:hypothetical protein
MAPSHTSMASQTRRQCINKCKGSRSASLLAMLCFLFRLYLWGHELAMPNSKISERFGQFFLGYLGNFQPRKRIQKIQRIPAQITRTARNSFTRTGRSSRRLLPPHHPCSNNPIICTSTVLLANPSCALSTRAVESACHRNGTARHAKKRSTL